jgi:tetratricopeptide (TPR) repeat protein
MTDLLDRLKTALSDRYAIERELGRGGMATVYLAEDLKHHRSVALKVLRPELAAALGPERFLREVEVTAKLTHPHILTLIDSGEADGSLYYVMPYIEGETLRARISREGQLPLDDALQITREVAAALSYAHSHDVIHRDIKPENVLLSAGEAVVADFGIARAITEAGGEHLTETGISIGTPAYMSPEQASSEQRLDGRSDVYSLGCVLYEMLAGEPPYTGPTAQAIVAKKLSDAVPRVSVVRERVPSSVEAAIDQALAKAPAHRLATAQQFVDALAVTPAPAAAESVSRPAVGTLSGTGVGLLVLTRVFVLLLGLPDWLWEGAIALVAIGVPALLLGEWQVWGKQRRWLTPRRALITSGAVLLVLGLSGAGYLTSRTLGIGPFATPISRGALESQVRLVLADFVPVGADTNLADAVTELVRTDLLPSPVVHTLPPANVRNALSRMHLGIGRLDAETAEQLAQREGLAAVIEGELRRVGGQYLLLARLTAAVDGAVLVSELETARDSNDLISAAQRLSRKLRERIGENLRNIRASDPLPQVTTASLPALVAYTAARRAEFLTGDRARAIRLFQEAIARDTTFAMAYLMLSAVYGNDGQAAPARAAAERAYQFRDRLSEIERLFVEAFYHGARGDLVAEEEPLRRMLELDPGYVSALNVFSDLRLQQRRFAEAESLALRALDLGSPGYVAAWNAVQAQVAQQRFAAARSVLARAPPGQVIAELRGEVLIAKRDFPAAFAHYDSLRHEGGGYALVLARLALVQGRLAEAERQWSGVHSLWWPLYDLRYYGTDIASVSRRLDAVLAGLGWDSRPPEDRETWLLIPVLAELGRLAEARQRFAEWKALGSADPRLPEYVDYCEGSIALAEGKLESAAAAFLRWHSAPFSTTTYIYNRGLVEAAEAFDRLGRADSAIVLYERALTLPTLEGLSYETLWYPFVLQRLGQLHESLGHRDRAIDYFSQFIDLWKDADPKLQPQVEEAREALARLMAEPGG